MNMMTKIAGIRGVPETTRGTGGTGGGDDDAAKITVGVASFKLLKFLKELGGALVDVFLVLPKQLLDSVWAIIMLVVIALIGLGIMYLIYVLNPRIPGLNHIVDIDKYVEETYTPPLMQAIKTIAEYASKPSSAAAFSGLQMQRLFASAASLHALGDDLKGDVATYLSFRSSIMNNDNFITAADLRKNAPQFVEADGTTINTEAFSKKVVTPLNELWTSAGSVSGSLHDLGDLRSYLAAQGITDPESQKEAVRFATAVHQVRMMMDQVPDIEAICMAVRPSKNAIWTLYYLPLIRNVFTVRIPSTWKNWPNDYMLLFETFIDWWNSLGDFVTSLPMTVAGMVTVERFSVEEVREGFGFGDIFSLAGAIANLMGAIGTIITTIARIFESFMSNPFMALVDLLILFLGILITIPLTILYFVATVLMLHIVVAGWYAFTLSVWWCVVYTLFLILTVILIAIPYFFLWILDIMTGGFVSRMMRCENNPHGWYADPGFAEKNEYSSAPLSCWGPCSERYKPAYGGTCCAARSGFMPDYCPQQQIYRLFSSGAPLSADRGPVAFVNFVPQTGFNSLTMALRKAAIEDAYMQKVRWYQTCYDNMVSHDYLNRHLCDNVDVLFPHDESEPIPQINVDLSTVCKEIFCDYRPGTAGVHARRTRDGHQEGNKASCDRLVEAAAAHVNSPAVPPGKALIQHVLLVTTAVIAIMISLRSIRGAVPTLVKNAPSK